MNIAQRLIFLREKKGITTNKLANLAGISQSHLREIELGKRQPTVETLSYFCDALGIGLEEFFREGKCEISPFLLSAIKTLTEKQQEGLASFINLMKRENNPDGYRQTDEAERQVGDL